MSAFVPHDLRTPLHGDSNGALSGVTVAVKDMYGIAGERVSGGSPAWLAAQPPAPNNSAVVDQLVTAGATIVGKTVCDEFFYSITGVNAHYGTPLNPRAPDRIPGGSSSGSASACSAGACDIAIGSDTAGSVRVPAALCGIYGIRTARGRMDMRGAIAMAPSFDAGGWFSASPGLFALPAPVLLAGWSGLSDDVRRVRLLTDAFLHTEPAVAELCSLYLRQIGAELPAIEEITIAGDRIDAWREAMRITQAFEVWQSFGGFISRHQPDLSPGVAERMKFAASVDDRQAAANAGILAEATDRMEDATADRTILVLPTCPSAAPRVDSSAEEFERFRVATMRLVCLASIAGLPQITIPIGSVGGAPIGISFIGWRNGEEALLGLAVRLGRYAGGLASSSTRELRPSGDQ